MIHVPDYYCDRHSALSASDLAGIPRHMQHCVCSSTPRVATSPRSSAVVAAAIACVSGVEMRVLPLVSLVASHAAFLRIPRRVPALSHSHGAHTTTCSQPPPSHPPSPSEVVIQAQQEGAGCAHGIVDIHATFIVDIHVVMLTGVTVLGFDFIPRSTQRLVSLLLCPSHTHSVRSGKPPCTPVTNVGEKRAARGILQPRRVR